MVPSGVAQCLAHFLFELQDLALRSGKHHSFMEKKLLWQHHEWFMEVEWIVSGDRGLESVRELCPAHTKLRASPSWLSGFPSICLYSHLSNGDLSSGIPMVGQLALENPILRLGVTHVYGSNTQFDCNPGRNAIPSQSLCLSFYIRC